MLRVLFVESDPNAANMAIRVVERSVSGHIILEPVERLSTAMRRLSREPFDAVLLDLDLLDTHGLETYTQVQAAFARLPIVLMVRTDDEATAMIALQHGAQDYLFKETYTGEGLVSAVRKSVERKRAEKGLTYLAQYDELTNVANRTLFRDRATQAVARGKRKGEKLAFLRVGIDRFKSINQTYGHDEGDVLLKTGANRLQSCVREVDTVARQWGDEFMILLEGISSDKDVNTISRRILTAISEPFDLGEHQVKVTASIGIALFPKDGEQVDDLLRCTEAAMNYAKEHGGNVCYFYTVGGG